LPSESIWPSNNKETELARSEFVSAAFVARPRWGEWLAFGERFHSDATPFPQASKPITVGSKMTALPVRTTRCECRRVFALGR